MIIKYVNYNYWANQKICSFIKKLTDEQLDTFQLSSFNTIRKTILHIWDAESIWFARLNGISPTLFPSVYFDGNKDELIKGFLSGSANFVNYINSITNDELNRTVNYRTTSGENYMNLVNEIIMHCMNHSTFHRGQLITMLRGAGYSELSSTDLIAYLRKTENNH